MLALWVELPAGVIVGQELGSGESLVADLERALIAARDRPLVGEPHMPAQVRVGGRDGVAIVRHVLGPEVPFVVAPTPEIQETAQDISCDSRGGRGAPNTCSMARLQNPCCVALRGGR